MEKADPAAGVLKGYWGPQISSAGLTRNPFAKFPRLILCFKALPVCQSLIVYPISWAPAVATPLPTALPLFATGLGALGLLGWRRKRKAQAAELKPQ